MLCRKKQKQKEKKKEKKKKKERKKRKCLFVSANQDLQNFV